MTKTTNRGLQFVIVVMIALAMLFTVQIMTTAETYAATVDYGTPTKVANTSGVSNVNTATYYLNGLNISGSGLTSAVISVNSGKITHAPTPGTNAGYTVYTDSSNTTMTFIWSARAGVDGSVVTNAIENVWYTPNKAASTNQVVEIAVSNHTNKLPNSTRLENVAAVKDSNGVMHYYMIIEPSGNRTWVESYNEAKTFQFMGMKGYLATMTNTTEKNALNL